MMAKMYPMTKEFVDLNISDLLFLNIQEREGIIHQASLIGMLSPIKCDFLFNGWSLSEGEEDESEFLKMNKFRKESVLKEEELVFQLNKILHYSINKDKVVLCNVDSKKIQKKIMLYSEEFGIDFDDIENSFEYTRSEGKDYSLDMRDSLQQNVMYITYLFHNYRFV